MANDQRRRDGSREWKNQSDGHLGVIKIVRNEAKGMSVEPDGTVWLTEEEEELTAQAPSNPARNPFLPQPYDVRDEATGEVLESTERPYLVLATDERFVPGREGDAPDGSADEREETEVQPSASAQRRRRRSGTAKAAAA